MISSHSKIMYVKQVKTRINRNWNNKLRSYYLNTIIISYSKRYFVKTVFFFFLVFMGSTAFQLSVKTIHTFLVTMLFDGRVRTLNDVDKQKSVSSGYYFITKTNPTARDKMQICSKFSRTGSNEIGSRK